MAFDYYLAHILGYIMVPISMGPSQLSSPRTGNDLVPFWWEKPKGFRLRKISLLFYCENRTLSELSFSQLKSYQLLIFDYYLAHILGYIMVPIFMGSSQLSSPRTGNDSVPFWWEKPKGFRLRKISLLFYCENRTSSELSFSELKSYQLLIFDYYLAHILGYRMVPISMGPSQLSSPITGNDLVPFC
jgi:hypothetical protein